MAAALRCIERGWPQVSASLDVQAQIVSTIPTAAFHSTSLRTGFEASTRFHTRVQGVFARNGGSFLLWSWNRMGLGFVHIGRHVGSSPGFQRKEDLAPGPYDSSGLCVAGVAASSTGQHAVGTVLEARARCPRHGF